MIPVIEKTGGRVLVRARVTEILTDDSGRAIGEFLFQTDVSLLAVLRLVWLFDGIVQN